MPPFHYAVRLRCPYETLRSTIGNSWSMLAKHIVAYEHPEEGNIHCHLLLTNVYTSTQHLKDEMWACGVPCRKAELSFKTTFKVDKKTVIDISEETWPKYIAYMSKGKYEPKYTQGFSDETIQSYRALWVDLTRDPPSYSIYLEFKKYLDEQQDKSTVVSLGYVKALAHIFMMNKHKSHTWQMKKEQSAVIDDYCYYNNIPKKYLLPYQDDT